MKININIKEPVVKYSVCWNFGCKSSQAIETANQESIASKCATYVCGTLENMAELCESITGKFILSGMRT